MTTPTVPSASSPTSLEFWRRAERVLVWLVAIHTLIVGVILVFFTRWGLEFGGYAPMPLLFFPHQGGAFHFVVGIGYLVEYERHRTVTLMLLAKSIATVFLFGETWLEAVPWAVPVSGLGDAVMGLAVWWVHRKAGGR